MWWVKLWVWRQTFWVQIPALLLAGSLTLGKVLNLLVPHWWSKDDDPGPCLPGYFEDSEHLVPVSGFITVIWTFVAIDKDSLFDQTLVRLLWASSQLGLDLGLLCLCLSLPSPVLVRILPSQFRENPSCLVSDHISLCLARVLLSLFYKNLLPLMSSLSNFPYPLTLSLSSWLTIPLVLEFEVEPDLSPLLQYPITIVLNKVFFIVLASVRILFSLTQRRGCCWDWGPGWVWGSYWELGGNFIFSRMRMNRKQVWAIGADCWLSLTGYLQPGGVTVGPESHPIFTGSEVWFIRVLRSQGGVRVQCLNLTKFPVSHTLEFCWFTTICVLMIYHNMGWKPQIAKQLIHSHYSLDSG